jgi:hypothetical protein
MMKIAFRVIMFTVSMATAAILEIPRPDGTP